MKRKVFSITTALLIISQVSAICVAKADYEERKQINKFYKVSSATEISLTNSFGKVHVNTWDNSELKVDIEIVVRSSSQEKAKDLLSRINVEIEDGSPSSSVSFRTSVSNIKGGNNSFEINYTVSMPKGNPLYLKNSFGDTYLGDFTGTLRLDISYGNLKAENLEGESEIDISFGGGTSSITSIKKGDLKLGYSKLEVGLMGQLDVNSQFSTLEIERAVDIDLTAKYGDVEFGEVSSLEAEVGFSTFKVKKLVKKLTLDIKYGGNTSIYGISNEIQFIEITNSFGPVTLEIPDGLNADISADMGFCNLQYSDLDHVDFHRIIEGNTTKEYKGKIGNGSSTVYIKVDSQYGDVRLRGI